MNTNARTVSDALNASYTTPVAFVCRSESEMSALFVEAHRYAVLHGLRQIVPESQTKSGMVRWTSKNGHADYRDNISFKYRHGEYVGWANEHWFTENGCIIIHMSDLCECLIDSDGFADLL